MNIAISTGLYYRKHYEDILDVIAESRCNNIELFLNQAFLDVSPERILEATRARNLQVSSIHAPLAFLAYERNEIEAYWIEKGLAYLEMFGAKVLVSHFAYQPGVPRRHNDLEHFRLIKHYATMTTAYVCTENLPKLSVMTKHQDSHALSRFLAEESAYLTYDTTHAAMHGRDIVQEYELYKNHIRNIHLSDFENGNEHKVLGHGSLPIKEFLHHIQADHYQHFVTLEFDFEDPQRNVVTSTAQAVDLLDHSLDYVQKSIQ